MRQAYTFVRCKLVCGVIACSAHANSEGRLLCFAGARGRFQFFYAPQRRTFFTRRLEPNALGSFTDMAAGSGNQ